jgi:Phospholipase_D-nuclease N-terminal
MGRIIYLAILVIDVIVIIDIIKSSKDTEKKILWIIAVVFLPVLGPILWYVIGRNNLS